MDGPARAGKRGAMEADTALDRTHARHFARLMELLPALAGRLRWGRAEIEAHQTAALRRLIGHAQARSPWHAARLAAVDAATVTPAILAERVPAMTKAELMEHWDAIMTVAGVTRADAEAHLGGLSGDAYFHGTHHVVGSGGTTGRTAVLLYDWDGLAEHFAGVARGYLPLVMRVADARTVRAASVAADSARHISYAIASTFVSPDNPVRKLPITLPPPVIAAELNAFQPVFLHSMPSALALLAHLAETGALAIRPAIVMSSSEPLRAELKARLRALWGAHVLDAWVASEGSGTFPCLAEGGGSAFHVSEDLNLIEPLGDAADSDGVLMTNLSNLALPLIRYRIEDRFSFREGPCECGVAFRAVSGVAGRVNQLFRYSGGAVVHPVLFETPLVACAAVLGYQVRQTADGAQIDVEASGAADWEALEGVIADALGAAGLAGAVVRVRVVERLPRTPAGKVRRIVPLA